MSEERNNDYGEEEIEEIEEQVTKNINTIFKKAKDDIEIAMESKEDQKEKISEILSDIQIPFSNKTCPNYFYDILETLRKKKCLDTFVTLVRVKNNNKLLYTIKEAYLKELNILAGIKDEKASLHMLKFMWVIMYINLIKRTKKNWSIFLR